MSLAEMDLRNAIAAKLREHYEFDPNAPTDSFDAVAREIVDVVLESYARPHAGYRPYAGPNASDQVL